MSEALDPEFCETMGAAWCAARIDIGDREIDGLRTERDSLAERLDKALVRAEGAEMAVLARAQARADLAVAEAERDGMRAAVEWQRADNLTQLRIYAEERDSAKHENRRLLALDGERERWASSAEALTQERHHLATQLDEARTKLADALGAEERAVAQWADLRCGLRELEARLRSGTATEGFSDHHRWSADELAELLGEEKSDG